MKQLRIDNITIVILFALLHFGVAVLSRALNYHDDILLTVLTITMVIIVAMRNSTRVDIMAILTLVATLTGYIIGSWLWRPISEIISNQAIAPGVSTLLITLTLGICIDILTKRSKRLKEPRHAWSTSARNIAAVALSILVLRLAYFVLFSSKFVPEGVLLNNVMDVISNTWALLTLLVGNIILTLRMPLPQQNSSQKRHPILANIIVSIIIIPTIATVLTYYNIPDFTNTEFDTLEFVRSYSAALLIDILIVTICIIVRLSTITRQELREERELKHRSEYQYERLKQQINPHFLFNSLGILDYLVQEQETERASSFIHKLASIYRYMLSNDQKPLVKLSEELEFTHQYIDLIKERFIEGLNIAIDIPEEASEQMVVPCALQLLVENATKHNIVSAELPLEISIAIEGNKLVVRNTLQQRTHGQPSTRLGLENIRQQYLDITGHNISVEKTDNEFIVKLPFV
ncbi:MAG: histidine kinase [Alistipes sp.]|nr:histidine kinase [Alistipes sp.]MBQ6940583.1 histidine kinase [Alistipes sp.]